MEVDQKGHELNEWNTVTKARFVMVSRDPMNKGSAILNPLIAETEEEKALFRRGEGNTTLFYLVVLFSPLDGCIGRLFSYRWKIQVSRIILLNRKQGKASSNANEVLVPATPQ